MVTSCEFIDCRVALSDISVGGALSFAVYEGDMVPLVDSNGLINGIFDSRGVVIIGHNGCRQVTLIARFDDIRKKVSLLVDDSWGGFCSDIVDAVQFQLKSAEKRVSVLEALRDGGDKNTVGRNEYGAEAGSPVFGAGVF